MIPNTRTKHAPSPIFGPMYGFSVGDLSSAYSSAVIAIAATAVAVTSASMTHGGNSIEVLTRFSDMVTTCTITVNLASDNTLLATFNNVSGGNDSNMFVGGYGYDFLLAGDPVTISISNLVGDGKVEVSMRRVA